MALTTSQKAKARFYCGWAARFAAFDTALDFAFAAIDGLPDTEALITNAITGDPPGLLALIDEKVAQLRTAPDRLQAARVGSIELNPMEVSSLRSEGRRLCSQLSNLLGVEKRHDIFGASSNGGNFVGK